MPLTVLSVAYPFTYVGEDAVGGSEQIITILDRALTEAGHRSLVLATEGSKVRGTLLASPRAKRVLNSAIREQGQRLHKRLIAQTLARNSVDLVHMHTLDFHQYLPPDGTPTLATLHLPPSWYPARIFHLRRAGFYLNCVSASEQKACPPSSLLLPPISNGVDIGRFAPSKAKRTHALALGRVCPEKAFHIAMDAARMAGVDFVLAGEVFPYQHHRDYFEREIVPRLSKRRQFVGPVNFDTKKRLLAEASCLLVTSEVQETSSLVAMEALAAGTPVIAFPAGALPEIVEHGRTGYIVANAREMADAIAAVGEIDRDECKKAARRRFSAKRMVAEYLRAYRRIITGTSTGSERPRTIAAGSWLVNW
ncbi:MAG TPA: glycosyltransferase [Candidatus Limnocylindrales bacterium]|nr:glycosyltransferase [Candidatus Limnocylindrales bacterium]